MLLISDDDNTIFVSSVLYGKFIGSILLVAFAFYAIYYVSKNILYYGTTVSYSLTIFMIMSVMAIFYRFFIKTNNNKQSHNKYSTLMMDFIFVIPCL